MLPVNEKLFNLSHITVLLSMLLGTPIAQFIQGGPKVGIQYIIVYSIITVYIILAHPV